ncbi:3-ketodihydrosphingosine reductase isoform X3 [Eptesicus fuscus]|uniref:3-ketodihydrosphingosine reductase isoform X3 n=1 Tax=Eptesicus fuscus TaxID=29078 RepID=UPI00240452F8|nr:3-ketodihydrosphingosine reductase isoform X3 [Eptesicus fuscus]
MMLLLVGTCLVAFVLLLYMLSPLISPKPLALPGAHVVVTGGSSGIGKCIAIECYKQGAFITLVARNEERLLQAKKEIEKHSINDKQVVLCISVDVSQDYSQVENVIKQAQEKLGPVDMLINCAGMSVSGKFEDLEVSTFEKLMSINYLGSVYPSRAVITTMKERRVGRIVFLSSQAGQVGLYGFTAYSSSKFAIKGLAEALQMEPLETRLISETTSICTPEQVAKQIVKDAIQGNFNSSVGSDGYMLSSLTCGMSPVTSITEGLQQVVTMGLFRMISLFYLGSFDNIIRRCMIERTKYGTADKTA